MSKQTKTLYIVRHAKSSWDFPDISDIDRPLKLRGIRNAYEMARRLKINRESVESIISSPAIRALHTADIFARVLELDLEKIRINMDLYGAGSRQILKLIKSQSNEISKLMIFGHNPDFSDLASGFSDSSYLNMSTCGLVRFDFDCADWENISRSTKIFEELDYPKKGA